MLKALIVGIALVAGVLCAVAVNTAMPGTHQVIRAAHGPGDMHWRPE